MTVLFVCREKGDGKISPITKAQANSLNKLVDIRIFPIKGRGWKAYVSGIIKLRKYLKSNHVDLIHAHYSHSAYIASLASRKPVVCSLMGSDVEDYKINRLFIRLFASLFWKLVIVKSEKLKYRLGYSKAIVIPNGINLEIFKPTSQKISRKKIGYASNKKLILFLADPSRQEKNYQLASDAFGLLPSIKDTELLTVFNIHHNEVPDYMSAADVILLTSKREGSSNVIKEAMACNCPIVSTDVGDVKEVIGNTEGCYITSFKLEDVVEKLKLALLFGKRTNGRKQIQYLDSSIIAGELLNVYKIALGN
jgi:teichuronic acid biosynthesis glycosyltransferase TuaC